MERRLLLNHPVDPDAEIRLFCLPYAGGAAAAYRDWPGLLSGRIQVCPLELPGRGVRMGEPPFRRMAPLVRSLAAGLARFLDRPYALFGHSMGGLVGFEFARTLRERGLPPPVHLFVSATAAPGTRPEQPPLHCASDEEVVERLLVMNGTPRQLLDNKELMGLMLPTLRADFSVLETYEYEPAEPLDSPITVFGGAVDPIVPPAALTGWRRQSSAGYRLRIFPGDHFFLHGAVPDIIGAIAQALRRRPDGAADDTMPVAAPVRSTRHHRHAGERS